MASMSTSLSQEIILKARSISLKNLEEMFPRYYMVSDVITRLIYSATHIPKGYGARMFEDVT